MRPHPPHSWAHPDFAALRFIPDALAVRFRLGDPPVVPCFHCTFFLDMSSSTTTGSSMVASTQFLHHRRWPSSHSDRLGTSKLSRKSVSRGAVIFEASLQFAYATTCRLARPPDGSDQTLRPANGDFYFRASDGLVARFIAGYHYSGNWVSSTGGTLTR